MAENESMKVRDANRVNDLDRGSFPLQLSTVQFVVKICGHLLRTVSFYFLPYLIKIGDQTKLATMLTEKFDVSAVCTQKIESQSMFYLLQTRTEVELRKCVTLFLSSEDACFAFIKSYLIHKIKINLTNNTDQNFALV